MFIKMSKTKTKFGNKQNAISAKRKYMMLQKTINKHFRIS